MLYPVLLLLATVAGYHTPLFFQLQLTFMPFGKTTASLAAATVAPASAKIFFHLLPAWWPWNFKEQSTTVPWSKLGIMSLSASLSSAASESPPLLARPARRTRAAQGE